MNAVILGVKAIALGWLSDERFPRACSTSADCFACCAILAGARSRVGHPPLSAEQHQLECVVPGDALSIQGEPVHPRARSWLQYRLTLASSTVISKSKLPLSNFRAKAVESERELTSTPNNSSGTLAKTIQTINCSFLPPYNVYLTWQARRLPYLLRGLRRIQEVSEYRKSRQKQQFFTKSDKHLY